MLVFQDPRKLGLDLIQQFHITGVVLEFRRFLLHIFGMIVHQVVVLLHLIAQLVVHQRLVEIQFGFQMVIELLLHQGSLHRNHTQVKIFEVCVDLVHPIFDLGDGSSDLRKVMGVLGGGGPLFLPNLDIFVNGNEGIEVLQHEPVALLIIRLDLLVDGFDVASVDFGS